MACYECRTFGRNPDAPACHECMEELSPCSRIHLSEPFEPCQPRDCVLAQHCCRWDEDVVITSDSDVRGECLVHRQLPLDAAKDRFLCPQHLAIVLDLEARYPSVVMSKCGEPGCSRACEAKPGKNKLRFCDDHYSRVSCVRHPLPWRPRLLQALQQAGLHGKPFDGDAAMRLPTINRLYKTTAGEISGKRACMLSSTWQGHLIAHSWCRDVQGCPPDAAGGSSEGPLGPRQPPL